MNKVKYVITMDKNNGKICSNTINYEYFKSSIPSNEILSKDIHMKVLKEAGWLLSGTEEIRVGTYIEPEFIDIDKILEGER